MSYRSHSRNKGNQHAAVFMNYLIKWPEVFAVSGQTTLTTACLLVSRLLVNKSLCKIVMKRNS